MDLLALLLEMVFSSHSDFVDKIKVYDKNESLSYNSLSDTVNNSDFIFYLYQHQQIKMVQ